MNEKTYRGPGERNSRGWHGVEDERMELSLLSRSEVASGEEGDKRIVIEETTSSGLWEVSLQRPTGEKMNLLDREPDHEGTLHQW